MIMSRHATGTTPDVAIDSHTEIVNDAASSYSGAYVTGSGSNRAMTVEISGGGNGGASAVTYNGVSLTKTGQRTNFPHVEMWQLAAPASGSHTLSVTFGSTASRCIAVQTWVNVDQTTPVSGFASDYGNASSGSVTVSSASGNIVIGMMSSDGHSPATDKTELGIVNAASGEFNGTARAAGSASVVMGWSWSVGTDWNACAASINKAP